jgi:hypothetical protein
VRNIIAESHAEHLLEPADALRLVKIIYISFLKGGGDSKAIDE